MSERPFLGELVLFVLRFEVIWERGSGRGVMMPDSVAWNKAIYSKGVQGAFEFLSISKLLWNKVEEKGS